MSLTTQHPSKKDWQGHLDFLLPAGQEWFSIKEIAGIMELSDLTIMRAFENGKVLGFEFNGRAKRGQEQRYTKRIPREHVLLFISQSANFTPADAVERHIEAAKSRSPQELLQIITGLRQILTAKQEGRPV